MPVDDGVVSLIDLSRETTDDPVIAGVRNFYKVEPRTRDDRIDRMLFAGYRVFVIAGLCVLAVIVTVGQLGRYLPDYAAADGHRQRARSEQHQAQQQNFPTVEKQQQPRHCYHCAISPADLSLSDMTPYGATITNHSNNTLEEITFEVTMKDCRPGSTAANSDNRCVIAGQESKGLAVFIPPGQARAFRSQVNFHDVQFPPRGRRFFLWRIVSAKGMDARGPYQADAVRESR